MTHVGLGPEKFGGRGDPVPWTGAWLNPRNTPNSSHLFQYRNYSCSLGKPYGRSRSTVQAELYREIRRKYLITRLAFQGHSKSSEPTLINRLLTSLPYRPISYRFRDKRRFQSKIANFPTPSCVYRRLREADSHLSFVTAKRSVN